MWRPESEALFRIREHIVEKPDQWRKIKRSRKLNNNFSLSGETLKRPAKGFPADHEFSDDIRRKDFIAIANFDHSLVVDDDILDYAFDMYASAQPLMKFLCDAQDLRY